MRQLAYYTISIFTLGILLYVVSPIAIISAHKLNPAVIERLTGEKIVYAKTEMNAPEEVVVGDPRTENRTFYSFPEWYIVYSAQEYGDFVKRNAMPSEFPFFGAVMQMWDSWELSQDAAKSAPDSTTKTILWTIAVSFSVEYGVIGLYENSIGQITEKLNCNYKTIEDTYVDAVAVAYGDSLNQTPWYDFPYTQALSGLWHTYGWSSLTPRGIERRLAFTMGYGIKALYANAIRYASDSNFGGANLVTRATVTNVSDSQLGNASSTKKDNGVYIVDFPRYRAFLPEALRLSTYGVTFSTIEDHSTIALSVVAPKDTTCFYDTDAVVYTMPILTQQPLERHMLKVGVQDLGSVILSIQACNLQVEHIYDY
jgi:hypothetical protein